MKPIRPLSAVVLAGAMLLIVPALAPLPCDAARQQLAAFCRPVFVASLPAPHIVMSGDVDGDGRSDIIDLNPAGRGYVDVLRMSPLGKPTWPSRAREGFGEGTVAACCAPFAEPGHSAVLLVLASGAIHLLHDVRGTSFGRDDAVGSIPKSLLPRSPIRAVAGEFEGERRLEALLVGADGRMTLLRSDMAEAAPPRFAAASVRGRLAGLRRVAAGKLSAGGPAEVVWMDGRGVVRRAGIAIVGDSARLLPAVEIARADLGTGLAVGRFSGGASDDILLGQRVLPGGDASRAIEAQGLPDAEMQAGDGEWIAARCHGRARDDLIRVRRSNERFSGNDTLLCPTLPGWGDSAGDGLLDCWKTGEVKPGGLDLAGLGCRVGHRDIIVEVQRTDDTPETRVHSELERVVRYFATLPVTNSDGTTGIALHVLFREPIAREDRSKGWEELGAKYHPASHRGVTHWMEVYNGGAGQSGEMTDRGGCGANSLYATFIHEFGHQLGLPHEGFWRTGGCPIYPSLMNYTYSYQLGGKPDAIGYSDGRLAGVVLNERHLSERLPLPPYKVAFLAGPPYHFRLKPGPDGKSTLIDWNWNGIFGEKDVAADINYGYSTNAGFRNVIGKTYTAPALAVAGTGRDAHLLAFAGRLPAGAPLPTPDGTALHPGLSVEQPGSLRVRAWMGRDPARDGSKWGDEVVVASAGVVGDPSACTLAGVAWVAYPTAEGVVLRSITIDVAGRPQTGAAIVLPDSAGAQPTVAALGRRLALVLWRSAGQPIAIRIVARPGDQPVCTREQSLGFASNAPVGAVAGASGSGSETLWIGLSQDQGARQPSRWQVRRFTVRGDRIAETEKEWIGGESGRERGPGRLQLLWERERGMGQDGRLYLLANGSYTSTAPWSCHYLAMRIADRTVNGGWLTRRYYDEWTQSRSAPGVCWFRGDVAFAARWMGNAPAYKDNDLFVGFFGRGIEPEPMGDFDDIGFIRDVGMRHCIPWMTE